jgi:cytochrome c oxidase subunit 4
MENNKPHITSYRLLATILVILLVLTFFSVFITTIHLGPLTVAAALLVASVKVSLVLIYFMHLKYESLFLKLMVSGVFLVFALVIIITFIDYLLR